MVYKFFSSCHKLQALKTTLVFPMPGVDLLLSRQAFACWTILDLRSLYPMAKKACTRTHLFIMHCTRVEDWYLHAWIQRTIMACYSKRRSPPLFWKHSYPSWVVCNKGKIDIHHALLWKQRALARLGLLISRIWKTSCNSIMQEETRMNRHTMQDWPANIHATTHLDHNHGAITTRLPTNH